MIMKWPRILALLSVIGIVVGCDNYALKSRITEVGDSLAAGGYRDTSLWRSLASLRPRVIDARSNECDSIYNGLVCKIAETASHTRYDMGTFLNVLRGNLGILNQCDLNVAHDLRYWGNYNAARSLYARIAVTTSMSNAEAVANLGMEYERLGLLRLAERNVLMADSLFLQQGSSGGSMWMQRLLYKIHSRLGQREQAVRSLKQYGRLHEQYRRFNAWQMVDTVTDVQLIKSIFEFPTWKQDITTAYGDQAQRYIDLYHSIISSSSGTWRNLWFARNPLLGPIPKPVIRRFRATVGTIPTMDSLGKTDKGELAIATRFGLFTLRGDDFVLTSSQSAESHIVSTSTAPLPDIDTMFRSTAPIHRVVPIGGDTLVCITSDSMILYSSGHVLRRIPPLPRGTFGDILDVAPVGPSHLLVLTENHIALLQRSSLNVRHALRLADVSTPGSFTHKLKLFVGIKGLSQNLFLVRGKASAAVICISVDTIVGTIKSRHLTFASSAARIGQKMITLADYVEMFDWEQRGTDTVNVTFRMEGLLRSYTSSRSQELELLAVPCVAPFIAVKQYDNIDIIDTASGLVYPQFALPIPIGVESANSIGIIRDYLGKMFGYYCDGNTLVRFNLRQQPFRFYPTCFITDHRTGANETTILADTSPVEPILARHSYSVGFLSNMITSSFPFYVDVEKADVSSQPTIDGRNFWTATITPTSSETTLHVRTPILDSTITIPVRDPITNRPWFAPFLLTIAGLMAITAGVSSLRARRRRQAIAIEHAKAEQLELLREDMHDMIGSRLVRIASLARQAPPERHQEALSRIHDMTLVTVRSLRNLLSLMSETSMTDAGFYGSLREYVMESTGDSGLPCNVDIQIDSFDRTTMDGAARHELLMIVSELLTNTLRHSQAQSIIFTVDARGSQTTLTWSDDGIGMDPGARRGNGLNNIQRRASRISATVTIESSAENGTRYTISFPTERG
ncbi:MAG: hypothetical protein FGM32_00795 [Candidatus Kapabacteria bacterium]|nr:hypothetical protein [Candidatus Kapabacteria bacterium]